VTADHEPVPVSCTINGRAHRLEAPAGETLLDSLRNRFSLTGTKEGCLEGECGACTVLIDDQPVDSCLVLSAGLDDRHVRTIEGLADRDELSPLQRTFIEHSAVQCGFCTPGILMTLTALLEQNPSPTGDEVRTSLAGNICRCTGYGQIVDAVAAVAEGLS
tara:strand:+ start:376 stop:858 length:483 start_codon:yes stop_codon:yes gene_type:complete